MCPNFQIDVNKPLIIGLQSLESCSRSIVPKLEFDPYPVCSVLFDAFLTYTLQNSLNLKDMLLFDPEPETSDNV